MVLTDPRTPRPSLHLMLSDADHARQTWGTFWDQFGGGFACLNSVLAGRMTSHLDTNYVPTSPEPQDVRRFYIHEQGRAWEMFPTSLVEMDAYSDWQCRQGLDRQELSARRDDLRCRLKVRPEPGRPMEVWRISIENMSDRHRRFSWFSCLRVNIDSVPSHYFVPRVVCEGAVEEGTLVFLNHDQNNAHPRQAFYMASPRFKRFDMAGEAFDGVTGRGRLPEAVITGRCGNTQGLQPYAGLVAAVQFDVRLAPGQQRQWCCVYGACPYDARQRRSYLDRVRREVLAHPEASDRRVREDWSSRINAQTIRTPDGEIDRYFNIWSRYQVRGQSRFCRALDKVGYRDILQDLIGICDGDLPFVRDRLLHTLRFQAEDGRAVRQYEAVPGTGHDMRTYMDSASWIPDALVSYLKESGDLPLLEEPVAWFDMAAARPDPSHTGTVYAHAVAAVRSLFENTGYGGLCRIGYGDWNDAISGIGGESGVSVWLSCACVRAAGCMAELARHIGRAADADEMADIAAAMTARINDHAWDGRWYIYAINGRGVPIGSHDSDEGRIHLNVNTWALFTGVAGAAGREEAVWDSLDQLATPLGHMLLAPPYTARSRGDVGRIADQKPGMFENGSIYMHGEAFYLYALICAGRSDDCARELAKTLPSQALPDIATGPRHQQSNFTVGPAHVHYGMQLFSNFTGSVSWYRRVIERMLGVTPGLDALVIAPCPPHDWDTYEVRKHWRGRSIHVRFRRSESPGCRITMNGKRYDGAIPVEDLPDAGLNRVDVEFG